MNGMLLLLADPSPCLRWLALRDLMRLPEDEAEMVELSALRQRDSMVTDLLTLQEPNGSWRAGTVASGKLSDSPVLSTAFVLTRLGYLGFDKACPAVERAAEYLFSQQAADGSWPLISAMEVLDGSSDLPRNERYSMIPLQTAFPLRGLAACGYAADPRAEGAYDWLLAQRLPDGAWPTGIAAGVFGFVGGYRRLAHSRWGCRSNTTAALICLSLHPQRRSSEAARRALDLVLGRETREANAVGYEVARLVGAEPAHGFFTYFARFDLALLLDLCSRVGASAEDERVASLLSFLRGRQGIYGLWEYAAQPQVSRWVSFDILRSISRLEENAGWLSMEPRTPFQPYPQKQKRF